MPQVVASLTITILTTLEVSFTILELSLMLLDTIYSTGITHDDRHLHSSYFYSKDHRTNKLERLSQTKPFRLG
jgi:hypothetical protein